MIFAVFCEFCRMGVFLSKEVGKNGTLGIWHITESLDELLGIKKFSSKDLSALNSFSYEHRKKEWLVSRIVAEKLLGENVEIFYNEHNKPFLENSKKHISLSHSHDLLTVILDESEIGIDIEIIKPKILRIKEKFMSDAEINSLQKENLAEQLTVYWCAKESLYKLYGKKELAFKENIFVEPFHCSEKGKITGWIKKAAMRKSFVLKYEKINSGNENYMLTYVIHED